LAPLPSLPLQSWRHGGRHAGAIANAAWALLPSQRWCHCGHCPGAVAIVAIVALTSSRRWHHRRRCPGATWASLPSRRWRHRRRRPGAVAAELLRKLNVSCSLDSEQCTLFDLVVLGCYIGPRVNKYAQTTDKNVDYHIYPSGKKVIKAFTANNFRFFDKNSQAITELSDDSIDRVDRVRITWRIQKNRQNNQTITLLSDKANTAICPVLAALRLVLRARRLLQPDSMPVACYPKKDALAYITGSRIAILFRAVARAMRPTMSKKEEQRYSGHSLRVWACVLLNEAGELPDYIKKHLRWMGDSFWIHLRNTRIIQDQHRESLRASSEEVMDLVSALPDNILCLSIMSDGTGDEDNMGVYHDDMD
jgi:hypothetical protein